MFGGLAVKPLPCLCILTLLILSLFLTTLDLKGYFSTESINFPYTSLIEHHPLPKYRGSHTAQCESPLKVYMYDLPRKFNLGMLKKNSSDLNLPWTSSKIPPWPQRSGLKKQHSVEYWMMVYLLGQHIGEEGERAAVRVADPDQADVFYVPFFASLSFNTHGQNMRDPETEFDKRLQIELIDMLKGSKSWQRSGGRDHVIVIHHPNAFRFLRDEVNASIFVVADFGRYPRSVAFLRKDIVAPYVHVIDTYDNDDSSDPFESRTTLLYFRGRTKRKDEGFVRLKLAKILGNHKRVHFEDSFATTEGFEASKQGMRSSRFCLHPAVKEALGPGYLMQKLETFPKERWLRMWNKLKQVAHHFEYQYPPKKDDAVDMLWKQVHRKLPAVNLAIHRTKRLKIPDWWRRR